MVFPIVADIPGILPGAHENIGLGHSFLRHIERCKSLLYILDPCTNMLPEKLIPDALIDCGSGCPDLYQQLLLLQNELKEYDSKLLDKQQIVVVNKMDVDGAEKLTRELYNETELIIVPISGLHRLNIDCLIDILLSMYKRK